MFIMARISATPSGRESHFGDDEFIVSKTDSKGRITYANEVFLRVARYERAQLLGKPHSLVRHPHMPRCVFKLLWDTIRSGDEMFGYILNMASNGDHYWVFAHVTPCHDENGSIIGYHSNRRKPDRSQIERIEPLYRDLLEEEQRAADRKQGMHLSCDRLAETLRTLGMPYDEYVFSL
jgi:PAS domain S-box-containing protein